MSKVLKAPKYTPQTNVYLINAVRNELGGDFARRIPEVTQANLQDTQQNLLSNRPSMNEFVNVLLNRIGLEIYRGKSWKNPLAKFKGGMLEYGDTIEEIQVGLAEAYVYDPDRDYLEGAIFGQERPEVAAAYHKINRQATYKFTINESMLRRAFNSEYGLSSMIEQLMVAPYNSDELDEFELMCSLFREYWKNGGFRKVHVADVGAEDSTDGEAKHFLRTVRALADNFTILSRHYNAAGMPVFADRDELELFITPEANAAIDVEALAAAFNMDKADMPTRRTVIPAHKFRIPGVQAILTTRDFFVVMDTFYAIDEMRNPMGRYVNHFIQHDQIISTSLFVPAVLLWTGESDELVTNETPVSGIEPIVVKDVAGNPVTQVQRGQLYELTGKATTDPQGGYNTAVRFELTGEQSPLTYIAGQSSLYVAPNESSDQLDFKSFATDDNNYVATLSLPVVGDYIQVFPKKYLPDADKDGKLEITPDKPAQNGNVVTIPTTNAGAVQYKDGSTNLTPGQKITLTANKTITVVALSGFELATGATASWTFNYTA